MNETLSKIENQLLEITTQLRFANGLNENEVRELYANLDVLKKEIQADKLIPVGFMILIADSISAINSTFHCNKGDKEKTLLFLDIFLDKLRDLDQ